MKKIISVILILIFALCPLSLCSAAEDADIKVIRFDGENDRITDAFGTEYRICENSLKLTSTGEASPYIEFDVSDLSLKCEDYITVAVVYKLATYTDGDRLQQSLEFTSDVSTGKSSKTSLKKDGTYAVILHDFTYITAWTGNLTSLKLNWISKVSTGSCMYIDSIVLTADSKSASAAAKPIAQAANDRTVENIWNDYRENHIRENSDTYITSDGTLYFRYNTAMLTAKSLCARLSDTVSRAVGYGIEFDIYSGYSDVFEKGSGNVKFIVTYGESSFIVFVKTVIISDSSYHDGFDGICPEYVPSSPTDSEFESHGLSLSDITSMPASSSGLAGHSNHECRVVDTPYGTYAVIPMKDGGDSTFGKIDGAEASVYKVENGTYTELWSFTFSNHTTKPNIFYAPDGLVYVCCADAQDMNASMYVGYFDPSQPFSEACETRKSIKYKDGTASGGYGYGQPILDTADGKIVFMYCGGTVEGHFAWFIYDYVSHTFETTAVHTALSNTYRHCYLYGFSDGNGGLYVVGGRDVLLSTLGLSLPDVSYAWDEVNLFHFPDIYAAGYSMITVNSADYSQKDRMMPTTSNNGHGDAYLDSAGYLHVLTSTRMHGADRHHNTLYWEYWHTVYDARTAGANPKPVYNEPVLFNRDAEYSCRMIESRRGELYIVAVGQKSGYVEIFSVDGNTFEKRLVLNKKLDGNIKCDGSVIVANSRNGSVTDTDVTVMMPTTSGGTAYKMFTVSFADRIKGDINGDSKINAYDAILLKKCIVGKYPASEECDINGDSKVNATDASMLKKLIVGIK